MPLVRVDVRNEYGHGAPEMYALANKEDPKEVLEGVAVAGLVGILRQLGDLAEFAAEVFHGLQEEVMITSSRSHKLMGRVKQIEAALPPLEKLVLAQRSHLHFAYTSGADWHVRRRCEQNHFIYSDLPRFIQDFYEQCKGPPHLNLLDKFDPGGPGSCLKRYSDPSFFRRASNGSEVTYSDKILKDKKGRKIKKRSSWRKNGEVSRGPSMSNHSRRMRFASLNVDGHSTPSQTVSTYDAVKSDLGDQRASLDSRNGSVDFECASHPRSSMQHEEQEFKESSCSSSRIQNNDSHDYAFIDEKGAALFDDTRSSLSGEQTAPSSFCVTWNGKAEILEPATEEYVQNGISETVCRNLNPENEGSGPNHSETGQGYVREMTLENFSTSIDQENEEGATYFENGEDYRCEMSLKSFSTNIDIVNVNGVTHLDNGKGYYHDESFETYSGNIYQETEIGDTPSETAMGYGYDEHLQTLSEVHDLESKDRGANEFGTATGYDHDESLEKFSTDLDPETEDPGAVQLKIASEIDIHDSENLPVSTSAALQHEYNENFSMPALDDIQPDDVKSENVVLKDFHLGCVNLPVSTSAVLQHEYNENLSMPALDDIQPDDVKSENVVQKGFHLGSENLPVSTSAALQHEYNENLSMPALDDIQPDDVKSENVVQKDFHLGSENLPVSTSAALQHEYNENLSMPALDDIQPDDVKSENVVQKGFHLGSENLPVSTSAALQHEYNENLSMPALDDIQPDDVKSENVAQKDFHLGSENLPVSTSAALQHEDVESETDQDHYVDALNDIDSEYDTDLDSQTKQVEQDFDTESKETNHGVDMLIKSNSESPIAADSSPNNILSEGTNSMLPKSSPAIYDSPGKVTSEDISNLEPFEPHIVYQPAEIANESLSSKCQSAFNSLQNGDVLGSSSAKSVSSNFSLSNSRQYNSSVQVTDMEASSSDLQKPPPEPSSICSIKFWTNGGLLGLEPSKPPDCTPLNVPSQVSLTSKDYEVSTSTLKPDAGDKRPESIEEAPTMECSTSCQGDRKGVILTKKASWTSLSADLSVNLQKLTDSHNQSYNNSSQEDFYSSNCVTVQPVAPVIASTTSSQERNGNSSRMFELGNRLLLNGFYRKSSLDKDDTSNQASSSNDGVYGLKSSHRHAEHKTFSERSKDVLGSKSPILSPSSSPPLGHMKMSFQPLNGFEAPKLQLKFPDGNVNHEGGRDLFPSFQLVPEASVPLHDNGSESDDDTFCRSSPYGSDCPSHESDSNSEQWESSESPRSKDQELYDALCRVSLTESVSTSWEAGPPTQGERNKICRPLNSFTRHSLEHSQSGHLLDIPGLDTINSSLEEEWRNHGHSKDHGNPLSLKELTPSPPPLPPPEWRAMKLEMELAEDKQVSMTENLGHEFDWKLGHTGGTQQPKPAPFKQEQIEALYTLKSKQQDLHKTRAQKEVHHRKELEEKEDFLRQIRTKSFSLRRTEIPKPAVPTGAPTSFQVTAILQKANAIRQAVGSDDGEDNWSDT